MRNSSRQAAAIKPGDYVSYADPRGVPHWGIAESGIRTDGPWPEIAVRFHSRLDGHHYLRVVPARDVERSRSIRHPAACATCGGWS
jgi:hypothetical protein